MNPHTPYDNRWHKLPVCEGANRPPLRLWWCINAYGYGWEGVNGECAFCGHTYSLNNDRTMRKHRTDNCRPSIVGLTCLRKGKMEGCDTIATHILQFPKAPIPLPAGV